MHIEQLRLHESREKGVLALAAVLIFYYCEGLSVYVLLFYLLRTYQLLLYGLDCFIIWEQLVNILEHEVADLGYYLSGEGDVDGIFEFFSLLFNKAEKS